MLGLGTFQLLPAVSLIYSKTFLKGTVSVFLSGPQFKDDNARLTTVPLKPLCVRLAQRYVHELGQLKLHEQSL